MEQDTRLWNVEKGISESMRSKEEAHDYRYFPEPDLPPLDLDAAWIDTIRRDLPELPDQIRERLTREHEIPEYDAEVLTETREVVAYFEETARLAGNAKLASNWVMTEVNAVRNKTGQSISEFPIRPDRLGALVRMIADGTISGAIGKKVFEMMLSEPRGPEALVEAHGLLPIEDEDALRALARGVIAAHPGRSPSSAPGRSGRSRSS